MAYLPLPYIQLEGARTNGTDYFDTKWSAGLGFSCQFAGCAYTNGGYLFGAMTSEDSTDKFALQFLDGKYIYYLGDKIVESPADYELGVSHYFSLSGGSWNIDGVYMPTAQFFPSPSSEMKLPVYIGAVNVGGEAKNLSDTQIGYIYFDGSSGSKQWRLCKTEDGQFGFGLYSGSSITEFFEKPDFTYGGVMAAPSGGLTIKGNPTKTEYKLGEPFDITGATVLLLLEDGTQRDVTDDASPNYNTFVNFRSDRIIQEGRISQIYYKYNPVGVEYGSFNFGTRLFVASISLPYTVSPESPVTSIEVTRLPEKKEYLINDIFDRTGMVVTANLENEETAEIGDSFFANPNKFTTIGSVDVTIWWYSEYQKYTFYADPFQVTVKNGVEKIIVTPPKKTDYEIGESFEQDGIAVTALYLDGTKIPVSEFSVDSSEFDNTKEGAYTITVKATIDEKEYSNTITVYVFGEPKKIQNLLGTTNGMTVIRNNIKNDDGKDTVPGVNWFVFDGNTANEIYVSGNNFISFDNITEHIKICRLDGANYYVYSQVGKLDNGHKFLKIRVEGYTQYSSKDAQYALNYELFLFDDNSMFLNILKAPTNTSYLGTSELLYGSTHLAFTVEESKEQVFSFYTTDAVQGKPWTVEYDYHEFIKEKIHTVTVVNGSGSGDYIEGDEVTVTADELEGKKFHGWTSSIDSIFDTAKVKNYNASGAVNPATIGNTLFYYYRTATKEPNSYSGWDYLGTINGKGQGTDTEYTYFVHAYKRNVTSEKDSSLMLPNVEIERAKDITLQDYTRQEAVLMSSGAKFTCKKTTDDLYLWVVFILYYWGDQKWSATPEIVTFIPENGSYDVLISDDNVPAEQFDVMPTSYPNYPASIAGFLVKAYGGEDKTLKFKMPAEDLTVTANYYWIEITKKPFKLNYSVGGKFDRSGMEVTAHFTNRESKVVTDYTISDLDSATVGAKTITVSYSDGYDTVSASFTVNVGLSGVQVKKYPEKQTYAVGETISKDEIEAVFVYSDGETTAPIEDFEITGFDSDETGIKNVTVTCEAGGETYNTSFPVSVTETGENPFSGYNHTRTLRIHFLTGGYNDITDIEGETMSLTESIGNDKNLKFGGCIASQFSVNIFSDEFLDPDTAPEGDIEVYIEADGQQLKIFTGTIESAERTGGISRRNLVAYDYLKRKGSIKLKKWYKSLKFPMTQKQFRDSLFSYVGIQQAQVSLKYDNARVPDNMSVDSLTFLALIKDICLNNMCFGHINADGKFEYIFLKENGFSKNASAGYYAPEVRIPDDAVISSTFKEGKVWYPQWFWISPNPRYPYEEWEEPSDMAAYRGNLYFVRNSYMTGDADWINKAYRVKTEQASGNVYYEEYELKYPIIFGPQLAANDSSMLYLAREYSLTTPGDLLRRIGTNIQFNSVKYLEDGTPVTWTINSYIMSRTITGIRSLKDVLSAKNSAYNDEAYGAPKEVRDNADSVTQIKKNMPKNTSKDENGDDFDEPFKGVDFTKTMTWEEALEKMQENPRALEAREKPNKVVVYPKQSQPNTGVLRYNGMTVSGTGFNVLSVTSLPSNPDSNTIYLIQGEVVVE